MKNIVLCVIVASGLAGAGCATSNTGFGGQSAVMASPNQLMSPPPIEDNSGKYMSPYTSDEVVAEWVDNAVKAKAGAALGSSLGSTAGQLVTEEVFGGFGMFGSLIGDAAGKSIGRKAAIEQAGGWTFIKETSDMSFSSWKDLSIHLYVEHSQRSNFPEVLDATKAIYTELNDGGYENAIMRAKRIEG